MSFQVVVTCTRSPCGTCRAARAPGYFLAPVANGTHEEREAARTDAELAASITGVDGAHRYDVAELRADGWPLCPWCGEDELYSLAAPASERAIAGCYLCGTRPPAKEA